MYIFKHPIAYWGRQNASVDRSTGVDCHDTRAEGTDWRSFVNGYGVRRTDVNLPPAKFDSRTLPGQELDGGGTETSRRAKGQS